MTEQGEAGLILLQQVHIFKAQEGGLLRQRGANLRDLLVEGNGRRLGAPFEQRFQLGLSLRKQEERQLTQDGLGAGVDLGGQGMPKNGTVVFTRHRSGQRGLSHARHATQHDTTVVCQRGTHTFDQRRADDETGKRRGDILECAQVLFHLVLDRDLRELEAHRLPSAMRLCRQFEQAFHRHRVVFYLQGGGE